MVSLPDPGPAPAGGLRPRPELHQRIAWLVLADGGFAATLADQLAGRLQDPAVRVVADARVFRGLLVAERPRLVIVAQPPAQQADLELVAEERRRRSRLRAVHLAPSVAFDLRLAALALGFDDALTLDTPPAELVGRLTLLDERAGSIAGAEASIPISSALDLDLSARVLRRGRAELHLRPKEFGLLALLAANPGRVFTRRELLDRVWGPDHPIESRTVDVHVRWLRAKIEPDPTTPIHLLTARGAGYRFEGPGQLTRP